MRFLAPWAAGFLLLIPLIIVFYLLKQKKESRLVSSTMLWQQVLADTVSQTPWQKLRKSLLLLLQLLMALLLVLALLRPAMWSDQAGGSDVFILLDTSASMAALEEGGKSRLELAKQEITELVDGKKRGTRFTLIGVGAGPQMLADRTKDKQAVLSSLKPVGTGNYQANLESTLSLVTALMDKSAQAQVVLYSDGGVILPELPVALADFEYRRVGSREDNLALGAFSLQNGANVALTRVDNYGSAAMDAQVKLYADGKLLDLQSGTVPAGKAADQFWNLPPDVPYLEARLDNPDALPADNSAWLVLRQAQRAKVLLVSSGNVFLEQALKLNPQLDITKVNSTQYPEVKGDYDLYVLDGFWPAQLPHGQLLIFNPPPESGLVQGNEGGVEKLEGVPEQPLLQNVTWADVHIAKSKSLTPSLKPLLKGGDKALIAAGSIGDARAAAFAFDLHQSDLPLRPAFPILMQNLVSWLVPAGGFRDSQISAGSAVELNLLPGVENVSVIKPDGSKLRLPPGEKQFADTALPGIYQLEQTVNGSKQVDYLAVNFALSEESQVKPQAQVKLRLKDTEAGPATKVNWEFWPWLALIVLPFLAVEWWVYLRGH